MKHDIPRRSGDFKGILNSKKIFSRPRPTIHYLDAPHTTLLYFQLSHHNTPLYPSDITSSTGDNTLCMTLNVTTHWT